MVENSSNAGKFVSMDISEAHATLDCLDREQRRQSWLSLSTIVVLATSLLSVWMFAAARSGSSGTRLALVVVLYLVLVFVFSRSALRHQRKLARRRRQAASQLGVIAAHETLNLILGTSSKATPERRQWQRVTCDQPLTVIAGETTYYGRICDISERGVGAIVPAALESGSQLAVEFPLGDRTLHLDITVQQRNGVRYGFEFVQLAQSEREAIQEFARAENPQHAKTAGAEGL